MWEEGRGLRDVLDAMLETAKQGDTTRCKQLAQTARHARQNLEGTFRKLLGHKPLQDRKDLGEFDKKRRSPV
jgi:hypothetical protein